MDMFDALFAPLARLMVARGVLFPALTERMKAHYVQAALREGDEKPTDSRVSVLTGLQRREVARLRAEAVRDERPNHLSRLVAMWQTDPEWSRDGQPLPLPRSGPGPSFEALAREVRRDVHARTMLDALIAAGTVELSADGAEVRLIQPSYQPLAGSDDQLAYLSRNLGDHLSAAIENVQGANPPHFERAVHYTELTPEQVATLEKLFSEKEMALFREISEIAAGMKRGNATPGPCRFRAGGYFYRVEGE